ncbi:MAG: hypothetical protein ABI693_07100 [Bryobacteraceae bacterium]
MSTAALAPLASASGLAPEPRSITVVATSVDATLSALREAGILAHRLHGSIRLIVTQIVPYPLPLSRPPVPGEFNARRFRVLADGNKVPTKIQICLGRDQLETLHRVLPPHSTIVVGGRKTWWPTREKRLARQLQRSGHDVVFTSFEGG